MDHQQFYSGSEIENFLINKFATSIKLPIGASWDDLNPPFVRADQFDCRNKSIKTAFSWEKRTLLTLMQGTTPLQHWNVWLWRWGKKSNPWRKKSLGRKKRGIKTDDFWIKKTEAPYLLFCGGQSNLLLSSNWKLLRWTIVTTTCVIVTLSKFFCSEQKNVSKNVSFQIDTFNSQLQNFFLEI